MLSQEVGRLGDVFANEGIIPSHFNFKCAHISQRARLACTHTIRNDCDGVLNHHRNGQSPPRHTTSKGTNRNKYKFLVDDRGVLNETITIDHLSLSNSRKKERRGNFYKPHNWMQLPWEIHTRKQTDVRKAQRWPHNLLWHSMILFCSFSFFSVPRIKVIGLKTLFHFYFLMFCFYF